MKVFNYLERKMDVSIVHVGLQDNYPEMCLIMSEAVKGLFMINNLKPVMTIMQCRLTIISTQKQIY